MSISIMQFSLPQGMNRQVHQLPLGAKVIHIEPVAGVSIGIWIEYDTQAPKESALFGLYSTGHLIPTEVKVDSDDPDELADTMTHVGVCRLPSGLWHVYLQTRKVY